MANATETYTVDMDIYDQIRAHESASLSLKHQARLLTASDPSRGAEAAALLNKATQEQDRADALWALV